VLGIIGHMAAVTSVTVERSEPAIRAALATHAPEQVTQFESEMSQALNRAAVDHDPAGVDTVLARWHALATMAANPLSPSEQAQVKRAHDGDMTGLRTRDEHGNWVTL
jgi:Family of unknown function (DUF6247)